MSCLYSRCNALPKKTIRVIKKTRNNCVLQVKWNQWYLHHECKLIPQRKTPIETHSEAWKRARGRRERRTVEVYERKDCDTPEVDDRGNLIKSVCVVTREARMKDTKNKCHTQRNEVSYYVSDKIYSAEQFQKIIRWHRGVENEFHYVRDVSMWEDNSRIRKNPDKMFRLRSWWLNIMRQHWVTNISKEMDENHMSLELLIERYPIF